MNSKQARQTTPTDRRTDVPRRARARARRRQGLSMLYLLIILSVVFAIASFAMDYGRVQLSKTQLRMTVDYAAKHAVQWVTAQHSMVLAKANEAAADNKVDGEVPVFSAGDLVLGNWKTQTRVFTPAGRPQNALRITSLQTIPLLLGNAVNKPSVTVRAAATAHAIPIGIVGLDGISFKNNTLFASYDSRVTTNPNPGLCNPNATLSSNGIVDGQNNAVVRGDIYYGPAGGVSYSGTLTGASQQLATTIASPTEPTWSPTGNPGGAPQAFVNNTMNAVLPGGTYWFTSFTVNQPMRFAGPATLYVNGNISLLANVLPHNEIPSNLTIHQIGASRTFTAQNSLCARVIAPRTAFSSTNTFTFRGTCIFKTMLVMNNCNFYMDEAAPAVTGIAIVQ